MKFLIFFFLLFYSTFSTGKDCSLLLSDEVIIEMATENDFKGIIKIGNQHRDTMGQVLKHNLKVGIQENSLFVLKNSKNEVLGFVLWHTRKDGWNTIYDIAVHRDYTGLGLGKILIDKAPRPRQLKVVSDNITAQQFYLSSGLIITGESYSRKGRKLIHFRDIEQN